METAKKEQSGTLAIAFGLQDKRVGSGTDYPTGRFVLLDEYGSGWLSVPLAGDKRLPAGQPSGNFGAVDGVHVAGNVAGVF